METEERLKKAEEKIGECETQLEPIIDDFYHTHHFDDEISVVPRTTVGAKFAAKGCLSDTLMLSCSGGREIFVVNAVYGKYAKPCSTCCPPHFADDCWERAETTRPSDWLAIKLSCDNQTACEYLYQGAIVSSCQTDYLADYMEITYDCLPHPDPLYAAFSVAMVQNSSYFLEFGRVLPFNTIITNYGGYFNQDISAFLCPVHGLYLFSASVQTGWGDDEAFVYLFHKDVQVALSWAFSRGGSSAANDAATATVTLECFTGDRVYLETGYNSTFNAQYRTNIFTGALLTKLE